MLKVLVKAMLKLIAWVPLPVVYGLGHVVGFVYGRIIRYHRKDALQALERSLPGKSKREYCRIANRMYASHGVYVMESIRYFMRDSTAIRSRIGIENREILEKVLERGKGAIILTAHFGNFDIMPVATVAHDYKLTVITKDIKNKLVNDLWMDIRSFEGLTLVPAKLSFRDCLKALRRNELVGFILDQNMKRGEGVFVDFFGKPASTSPGLAYMAAQAKAPVVPAFIYPAGKGCHAIRILPAIEPPEDRAPECIEKATQEYTKVIEDVIREDPEQWIWMHRRWRTQMKP